MSFTLIFRVLRVSVVNRIEEETSPRRHGAHGENRTKDLALCPP